MEASLALCHFGGWGISRCMSKSGACCVDIDTLQIGFYQGTVFSNHIPKPHRRETWWIQPVQPFSFFFLDSLLWKPVPERRDVHCFVPPWRVQVQLPSRIQREDLRYRWEFQCCMPLMGSWRVSGHGHLAWSRILELCGSTVLRTRSGVMFLTLPDNVL